MLTFNERMFYKIIQNLTYGELMRVGDEIAIGIGSTPKASEMADRLNTVSMLALDADAKEQRDKATVKK